MVIRDLRHCSCDRAEITVIYFKVLALKLELLRTGGEGVYIYIYIYIYIY